VPCPAPGTQLDSLIMAPRGEPSAKPQCFLEMIEKYFPTVPKIELNRRGAPRPGWDAWGNEASAPADDRDGIPGFLDRRPA
jgi:N6-adenosine-specific RNA methylase IME4